MMKTVWIGFVFLLIAGCGHEKAMELNGFVVGKDGLHVLIAEYPPDDSGAPQLFRVYTGESERLDVGQKVHMTLRPEINDSFPPGATAKSVRIDRQFDQCRQALNLAIGHAKSGNADAHVYIEDVTVDGGACIVNIGELVSPQSYRHAFEAAFDLRTGRFEIRP